MKSSFLKNTVFLFFSTICLLQVLVVERSNWTVKPCFRIKIFVWFVCPWRNQAAAASLPWEPLVTIFNSVQGLLVYSVAAVKTGDKQYIDTELHHTKMIRHGYYCGIAASVVLLLCSAMKCLALLCLPPTSSSSLLVEKRQCCLNSLSGPAINKGRDWKQPLLAGHASSSPSRAANHQVSVGLRRNDTGESNSAPLEVVGLGWISVQHPQWCEHPGSTRAYWNGSREIKGV